MRSLFYCLLIIAVLLTHSSFLYAQAQQQANEVMFSLVKELVNARNADSLYSLLNDGFKEKLASDKFIAVLVGNLYPHGMMKEYSLIKYSEGMSSYKTVFDKDTLEFRIAADTLGKIAGLRFLPYKAPSLLKTFIPASDNPMRTATDSMVDKIAREYISKANTVGLSIGIIKNGGSTVYSYGTVAKGKDRLPGADAVFEIGSITKTFTATLLAYYVGEHKVALSDPITKYLPDTTATNPALAGITLQMLSNHTSGLPRMPDNMWETGPDPLNPYEYYGQTQMFHFLDGCKPSTSPGSVSEYSNLGFALLGKILQQASGITYEQMVKNIITGPLGMTSTFLYPDAGQKGRQVSVYNEKGELINMWDLNTFAGAGAIRSDMHDMLLYAQANMQNSNTPLGRAIALTHKITYDRETTIGLGWIQRRDPVLSFFHNGATGGCKSYMAFSPEKQVAVVVLSNSAEDPDPIGDALFARLVR